MRRGGNSGCTSPVAALRHPSYTLPVHRVRPQRRALLHHRRLRVPRLGHSRPRGPTSTATSAPARSGRRRSSSGTWSSTLLEISLPDLTTFGEEPSGEIYAGTSDGALYLVAPPALLPPTIDTIAPPSGFTRGGEAVAITGTNFTSQTRVYFGAFPATVVVQSPTALVATTPAHPAGLVDVTVVNNGAPPAVRTLAFGYLPFSVVPTPGGRLPRVVDRP